MAISKMKDIQFGFNDGSVEVKRVHNIDNIFYDEGHVNKLKKGEIDLVIGKKGSGKSMLVSYFAKKSKKEGNSARVYPMAKVRQKKLTFLGNKNISEEESVVFWEYVLLDLILDQYEQEYSIKTKEKKELQEVKSRVKLTIKSISKTDSSNLDGKLSITPSVNGHTSTESVTINQVETISYSENLDNLFSKVSQLFKNQAKKLFLIIDDLDELSVGLDSAYFNMLSLEFVNAIHYLNNEFEDIGLNVHIITTLRTDLVENMNKSANNLSKYINDTGITLNWFVSTNNIEPWNRSLVRMILQKVTANQTLYRGDSAQKQYRNFFRGEPVHDEADQSDETVFSFMGRHGFGRPRDTIMFFNTYKEAYPDDTIINYGKLQSVLAAYSHKFYNEFLNELAINPHSKDLNILLQNVISDLGKKNFFVSEIHERWVKLGMADDKERFFNLIKELYAYGIIGQRRDKVLMFSYYENANSTLYNVDMNDKFAIHAGIAVHFSALN